MRKITIQKIERRIYSKLVSYLRHTPLYPYLYRSYWHFLLHKGVHNCTNTTCYYAAHPNSGAGIGHQMANWIAGYWFARRFGLKFAYLPFSKHSWDEFLGFSKGEVTVAWLKSQKYKTRRLPLFDENNQIEVNSTKAIIASYTGKKIVFIAEQDQFYRDQFGVMGDIQTKFYSALARKEDHLVYDNKNFNIAIHVRRGDIMVDPTNPNLAMRYLSNDYFEKVLTAVVINLKTSKPIHIYFFSQGKESDYPEFQKFPNVHWCLDMGAQQSFAHFVFADLLITSKSSFSYKPALMNRGIKICPRNFWHGYPDSKDWILCENDGTFEVEKLEEAVKEKL